MATGVLWSPSADRISKSALREYLNWLEDRLDRPFPDHDALWAWSVEDLDQFWHSIIDYYEVEFSAPWTQVRTADPMPHTRWFSGGRLNWAQHALRRGADDATALVCVQEGGEPAREITRGALRQSVAAAAGWLRRAGVRPGDRVAAYLPNTEHAVIGCLAAAIVCATPLNHRDDLQPAGQALRRYEQAGFDDAVVLIGPEGPDPEEVRALLPRSG